MVDTLKNVAYSTVATAPSPATSGTSLVVTAGGGARFPSTPFDAVIWAASAQPVWGAGAATGGNFEIVRVTSRTTDTLTITRAQYGTTARTVVTGDQVGQNVTKEMLDAIVAALPFNKSLTTEPAIANTETVVISYTCAANELAAGTTFRFKAFATRSGTSSVGQTIRVRVGTTTLTGNIAATLTVPNNALQVPQEIEALVTVITAGAGGTIRGSIVNRVHLAAVTVGDAIASTAAVAVDTTAANMLIELTLISGNAGNTFTFRNVVVEKVVA